MIFFNNYWIEEQLLVLTFYDNLILKPIYVVKMGTNLSPPHLSIANSGHSCFIHPIFCFCFCFFGHIWGQSYENKKI